MDTSPSGRDGRREDENGTEAVVSDVVDETTALLAPPASGTAKLDSRSYAGVNGEVVESHHDTDGDANEQQNANGTLLRPEDTNKKDDDKPLPKLQILMLCYARLVEPIAFFSIFPFVNEMIWRLGRPYGLKESQVGFYSGLIESLFSATQMLLMIPWGRAADRIGRKPILVSSLVGVSVATAVFGLSRRVWQMIAFRCLAGIFAGTIVTIRTMISEISTPKTQARAFSFFAFSGNLGIFLGPFIGGALAGPADRFPGLFGRWRFWTEFPYALPTFVTGVVGASAAVCCALFVKETLIRRKKGADGENDVQDEGPMSTWEVVRSPGVGTVLYIYGHTMILAYAYTAVVPVFYFTQPALGGLGFSPLLISIFMGVGGLSQSIWILLAFPWLQKRFGTGGVLRGCAIAYPFFFVMNPVCNLLLRKNWTVAFWVIAPPSVVLGCGVSMSFSKCFLNLQCLPRSFPDRSHQPLFSSPSTTSLHPTPHLEPLMLPL